MQMFRDNCTLWMGHSQEEEDEGEEEEEEKEKKKSKKNEESSRVVPKANISPNILKNRVR
jgi:hypothetical protein